jgi:hypothetical protein
MLVTSNEPGINFKSCKVFPTDLHVKSHPPPGFAGAIHCGLLASNANELTDNVK